MQKHLFATALLATVMAFGSAAWAEGEFKRPTPEQIEQFKNMTPEQQEKFHAERKAKWEAMPTSEKVNVIEKARAERRKASDEHWKSLSDEEKVQYVEERMKRYKEKGGKEGLYKKDHHHHPAVD